VKDQASGLLKFCFCIAWSQQAIVADSDKTRGQNMEEEAPDKLVGTESNEPVFPRGGVVPGSEGDPPICHAHQPLVGDGHPVGVAAYILEDVLRPTEGFFGIDHPFFASEFSQEAAKGRG
jgi:hypothetical protein